MPRRETALVLLVLLRGGWALGRPARSVFAERRHGEPQPEPARIPKTVFVTGPFSEESESRRDIVGNISAISFLRRREPSPDKYAVVRAGGATVKFFDDRTMAQSAYEISNVLSQAGVVDSAFEAFESLRPMAYRADLWRYMVLWHEGGIYLDMNVRVLQNLSSWINFDKDRLLLIQDGMPGRYWNAIMAARPRDEALEVVIRHVVRSVLRHSYGRNDLDITGPEALYRALRFFDGVDKHITVRHKLQIKSSNCGAFPKPPCAVEVVGTSKRNKGVVIARKEPSLQGAVHNDGHYSKLYLERAVYCDEPGPPCPAFTPTAA